MDMARPVVDLSYTLAERGRFEYPVFLHTTQPHFGGLRWWFGCPLCGRRVQKLYRPESAGRFGCRNCHDLSYTSRSKSPLDRSLERARRIRARLGGTDSPFDPFPTKPKGMW